MGESDMSDESKYRSEVQAWDDNDVIFIKTYETYGDPVELGEEEVVELIIKLMTLLKKVQGDQFKPIELP